MGKNLVFCFLTHGVTAVPVVVQEDDEADEGETSADRRHDNCPCVVCRTT